MVEICPQCKGTLHIEKEGNWFRCSCVKNKIVLELAIKAGVDVRFVSAKLSGLKAACPRAKYQLVQNYLVKFKRALEKGEVCRSLELESSSPDILATVVSLAVREALRLNKTAVVYYVQDLLLTIGENTGKRELYQKAVKGDLICFDLTEIYDIAPKGIDFASDFIAMVCRRRLREGKVTIVVYSKPVRGNRVLSNKIFNLMKAQFDRVKL